MSDLQATVAETASGFEVQGVERINYSFSFLDGVFNPANVQLAEAYKKWGRCLAIADINVCALYGDQMHQYFEHHGIKLEIHKTKIGEKAKTMETLLAICEAMTNFGIIRKEPVLVVGGGLITDVAGYANFTCITNSNSR
jgi:3-dehydroquinate synthase